MCHVTWAKNTGSMPVKISPLREFYQRGFARPVCPSLLHDTHFVRIKKAKCTLVQALRLCTGCTAHRGSRGIALLFHDHGTRRG